MYIIHTYIITHIHTYTYIHIYVCIVKRDMYTYLSLFLCHSIFFLLFKRLASPSSSPSPSPSLSLQTDRQTDRKKETMEASSQAEREEEEEDEKEVFFTVDVGNLLVSDSRDTAITSSSSRSAHETMFSLFLLLSSLCVCLFSLWFCVHRSSFQRYHPLFLILL